MTFTSFALKHTQGPYGDVAMDLRADPQVKRAWSYRRLCRHLMDNHRPVERVWLTLEAMKVSYDDHKEFKGHPLTQEECEFCGEEDEDGHECLPERAHLDR
jgi:hypothetical protein